MRNLLTIFFSCMLLQTAIAQGLHTRSYNLSVSNHAVKFNTICKTSQGYIYAGTSDGLYSFDGINFKKINFEKPESKDTVTAIFEDNTRQLWVGFKNGRIAKKINSRLAYFDPEEGSPKAAITAFLQDKKNNIWFATNGEGIYHFYNKHIYLIDSANGLNDLHIHSMALAENGDVLAATDAGINICKTTNDKTTVTVVGPKEGLPDYYVTAIATAGNDQYWIGLQEKGFCKYDHKYGRIITQKSVDSIWRYGQVNALHVSQYGLWIATEENGLVMLENSVDPMIAVKRTSVTGKVTGVLQDNEGNIWANTSSELKMTAGSQLELLPFYNETGFSQIRAMLFDGGNYWIASGGSLTRFSIHNGDTTKHVYHFSELNSRNDISCLYQDLNGHIWIGTMGKGILLLDPVTGKYRSLNENPQLNDASILSITGNGNTVCAGGLEGVGMVFDLDGSGDLQKQIHFTNYTDKNNAGLNVIYSMLKDSKGRIWFGTGEKGITLLQNNVFLHYGKEKGLLDDRVFAITEDRNGNIWFTTKTAGVYRYDGKNFKNYAASGGISDLEIIALTTDPLGNIVLVNKKGLDVFNSKTETFSYVDNTQGISPVTAYPGAVSRSPDGRVAFCTSNGIVLYQPEQNAVQQPTTLLESVQLFLSDVDLERAGDYSSDQNTFQFYFTALYYTNPDGIRYQYKLEGLDTAWINTLDRNVSFLRLPPGTYKFHVRASLSENFEGASEATYEFVIHSPLWKRWWFIILCVILGGGLIYLVIKARDKRLKNIQLLKQEKIQFQFQVLRNQINPHFLFNSFNTLISFIEDDPKLAVNYVEHLSEFFRNIVNYRDKDVITVGEELILMETYFYLQQKRFGDHLRMQVHISEETKKHTFIPPLTLQLLMENAIKHNAVSREAPLLVELFDNGNGLVVKNNINPKRSREASSGMGLQNIVNRYNLLTKEQVQVTNDGKYFIVLLPTLKQE